jgi:Rps23 Pro-64 3,4-dihydroxylase Tpa1-like proline 4-hydroxylase
MIADTVQNIFLAVTKGVNIKKNFITELERAAILENLSQYYQQLQVDLPGLAGVETALGYNPNSKDASFWSLDNPIRPYNNDANHDSALRLLYNIQQSVSQELTNVYNKKFRLVNCILNKMIPGCFNGMHTDDQPGYDDPVHTALIYLSGSGQDFTGGAIHFQHEDITINPDRNMLIFFRGSVDRPHEVKTVLSGTRETITMQFTVED